MTEEKLVELKEQVYKDPRPTEHFDRFHERTRTREPDFVYEVVRIADEPDRVDVLPRARLSTPRRSRRVGPVILAPNHFSFLDHFFLGVALRRKVHFMAKSQLFKPPMEWIYTHGGVFPVRRGFADEEAFITARQRPRPRRHDGHVRRGRPLAHRRAVGEAAARDRPAGAAESGAPIVPVAIHRLLPRAQLEAPAVPEGHACYYGDPFAYERVEAPTRDQEQAAADAIFAEVRALYDAAAKRRRPARPEPPRPRARRLPGHEQRRPARRAASTAAPTQTRSSCRR